MAPSASPPTPRAPIATPRKPSDAIMQGRTTPREAVKPSVRNPPSSAPIIIDVPDVDQPRTRPEAKPKPLPAPVKPNPVVNNRPASTPVTRPLVRDSRDAIDAQRGNTPNINNSVINNNVVNNSVVNNGVVYNDYVSSVSYSNGWGGACGWVPPCGPCDYWQPYDSDGFSFAIGFGGSGWNLGFYFGSGGAPLCGSWGNPWWNGYASASYCQSSWNPCWNPCFRDYWSNCWWGRNACYPYGCYPIFPYTPNWCAPYWSGVSSISYTSISVGVTPSYYPTISPTTPVVIAPLPSVDAMWSLLSDGFDQDAAQGFDQLVAYDTNDAVSRVGEALAHAFGGDLMGAAITMRQAVMVEPGVFTRIPLNPALAARTTLLLDSLRAAVAAVPPSLDALYMKACCQALLGNEGDAYFTTTLLIREHDASASTLALQGWLDLRLRTP